MLSLRCLSRWFLVPVLCSCSLLMAQSAQIAPRITAQVDESRLISLSGNVPTLARAEFDRGEVDSSTQLAHIRLVLARSGEQKAALDKYLAELMDKSSPNYHKWLTPEQYGKLYGPADSDMAAIVAWLESHGLKLEEVSKGRTNIAFSGTAGQVEEAFHTHIHSFDAKGRQFFSNTSDPAIPAALAPVVAGVAHLNTIRPVAYNIAGPAGHIDPETKRLAPIQGSQTPRPRPNFTVGSGTASDPYFLYIVPGDAATIYDTPNTTFNANFTSGTSYDGTGVKIGIGGDALIKPTTVAAYRNVFLGNSTQPTIIGTVTDTTDTDEAYIDTELSGGLAPGATIYYYPSADLVTGIMTAIDDNTIDIFSLSFGLCELEMANSNNVLFEQMWQQAFAQGIAVVVSTGDNGSATCDAIDPSGSTQAQYGLSVSGFASTPYNVAVGGTDFAGLNGAYTTYVNAPIANDPNFYRTAKSYIPESTWNDSTNSNTTISANTPLVGTDSQGNPLANIVADGGGASDCSINTSSVVGDNITLGTCTSGYAKPSWQSGAGVPSGNARYLPDVSLMAGNGFDPATWLVCTDDTGTVGTLPVTADCTTQSNNQFYFVGYGGTSTAAPAFAGILALVEQKTGGRLGQAAAELYGLYNGSHGSAIFHDVTVGNNSVPCVPGSPNCTTNAAGYPYLTGFDTTAGYDEATGLGSVDVKQLVTYWGTAAVTPTPALTVTPSASSVTTAQSFTVAVTVAGTSALGTPTGTVTLSATGYTSTAEPLVAGAYIFNVPAGLLLAGDQPLSVAYSGDANYSTATATSLITVTEVGSFSLKASAVTVAPGSSGTSTITATATGGYTGTITLTSCALTTTVTASTPTCTIGNSPIVIGSGMTTATGSVTINTMVPGTAVKQARNASLGRIDRWLGAGGIAFAGLLLFGIPARQHKWLRNWPSALVAILVFSSLGVLYGCGGGGGGGGTTTPTVTAPIVTTGAVSTVTANSASLAGTIDPNGGDAHGDFLYGTDSQLAGAKSTTSTDYGSGQTAANATASLTSLTAATKYYYQLQASNSAGTGTGSILSFTTGTSGTPAGNYTFSVTGTDAFGVSQTATLTVTVS